MDDEKCVSCRLDDVEAGVIALSKVMVWMLIAGSLYALYRSGVLNLEILHG